MANYPSTIPIDNSSTITGDDGITPDRADDGTVRGRVNYASTFFTFNIVHDHITETDMNTIMSFYDTEKGNSFLFSYNGVSYTLYFASRPQWKHLKGGWWRVTSRMVGNET